MPKNGRTIKPVTGDDDVLTLEEAAQYLRVPAEKLILQAEAGQIPARSVGGEWRFLKSALVGWLKGSQSPPPRRGSWEAIAPFVGVFRDEEKPEEYLARLREIREEGNR